MDSQLINGYQIHTIREIQKDYGYYRSRIKEGNYKCKR